VHAGLDPDPATGAVVPPIHMATTFERDRDGGLSRGWIYGREDNPTRHTLEDALARMEGAAGAAAFGSGLAATSAVFTALRPGARVLMPEDRYFGVGKQLEVIFARWELEVVEVATPTPTSLAEAVDDSIDLVWIETPSNPGLLITDVAAAAEAARRHGAISVCDATWTTPIALRPLDLGCDLVVHSTTKYIGGHSDVTGGLVAWAREGELAQRIRENQRLGGGVPSPFDAFLLLRGLRTLPLRMQAHAEGAMHLAEWLTRQPAVHAVLYPGLPEHPGHEVAARQMANFGGMLSFRVHGGAPAAAAVAGATHLFRQATSLGGVESLIEHRGAVEGPGTRAPLDLLRVSVGIEHPADLERDLGAALAAIPAAARASV
jgi:cystathionine gamma-synthase